MHLLETYALPSGCKISEPFIHLEPIDLPKHKYMTFHGFHPEGSSKQYKRWSVVLEMLKDDPEFTYDIIQIGGKNDERYENVDHSYLGKTTYHSLAYLIKNAELHLGFDSLPVHLASHFNTKIVAIYPWYAQNCGPYFSKKNDCIILEPDFSIYKPCFSSYDKFDLINTIEPKTIYDSVKCIKK